MITYNNDASLKAEHVRQAKTHFDADMLLSGTYGENLSGKFRGCSVGCFAHDIDPDTDDYHAVVADHYVVPEWIVRWQDTVFEGLPDGERQRFHVELAEAMPLGADLSKLHNVLAILRNERLLALELQDEKVNHAIRQVSEGHFTVIREDDGSALAAWSAARSATWSAARSAARSAAEYAARSAAESAAWSAAESAARSAAWSAAWSATWSAAWSAEFQFERDAMLDALRNWPKALEDLK